MTQACQLDGLQYMIPADWGFASVLYRGDKVEPADGVESWSLLYDERYEGKISWWESPVENFVIWGYVNGVDDPWDMSDEELDEAKRFLSEKKKLCRNFWSSYTDLNADVAGGNIWIAYSWQDAWLTAKGEGIDVVYADPEEGRLSWLCGFVLGKDTDQYRHAHAYADTWISKPAAIWMIENYAYGHANASVDLSKLDPSLVQAFRLDDPTALDEPKTHIDRFVPRRARVREGVGRGQGGLMAVAARATLPASWYADPEVARLERDRIFRRSWLYVGRAEAVAEPGSYLASQAGHVPVVVTRDGEGVLRGFVNVCRHRAHSSRPARGGARPSSAPTTRGRTASTAACAASRGEARAGADPASSPCSRSPSGRSGRSSSPAPTPTRRRSRRRSATSRRRSRRTASTSPGSASANGSSGSAARTGRSRSRTSSSATTAPSRIPASRRRSTSRRTRTGSPPRGTWPARSGRRGPAARRASTTCSGRRRRSASIQGRRTSRWTPTRRSGRTVAAASRTTTSARTWTRRRSPSCRRSTAQVGLEDEALIASVQRGLSSGAVPEGRLLGESEALIAWFQALVADALAD